MKIGDSPCEEKITKGAQDVDQISIKSENHRPTENRMLINEEDYVI